MFRKLKENWKLARAENLLEEFEDLMNHFQDYTSIPLGNPDWIIEGASTIYKNYIANCGDLRQLSDKQIKDVVRSMQDTAKRTYETRYSSALGMSLVAIWLESLILPGPHAERVTELSEKQLKNMRIL